MKINGIQTRPNFGHLQIENNYETRQALNYINRFQEPADYFYRNLAALDEATGKKCDVVLDFRHFANPKGGENGIYIKTKMKDRKTDKNSPGLNINMDYDMEFSDIPSSLSRYQIESIREFFDELYDKLNPMWCVSKPEKLPERPKDVLKTYGKKS